MQNSGPALDLLNWGLHVSKVPGDCVLQAEVWEAQVCTPDHGLPGSVSPSTLASGPQATPTRALSSYDLAEQEDMEDGGCSRML